MPQVATTLSCLFFMFALNSVMMKGAKQMGPIEWGKISARSQYALIMLATAFTWMMGLMGYIRSSVRLFWHVNEIMRDNSPVITSYSIHYTKLYEEYARFAKMTKRPMPRIEVFEDDQSKLLKPEYAVMSVSWDEAAAYCKWAGNRITSYNVCYTKLLRSYRV